jgi:hypothetical protein
MNSEMQAFIHFGSQDFQGIVFLISNLVFIFLNNFSVLGLLGIGFHDLF